MRQRFSYDKAGRLVKVEEADTSWQPLRTLREFGYAEANGSGDWRKGKLWWQRAYNFWDDGTVVEVRQDYTYGGLMGAVSQELVTVSTAGGPWPSLAVSFTQRYGYGAQSGQVEVHHYPHLAGAAQLPRRRVDYRYEKGMLTQVLPWYALEVAYWPNFLPRQVRRVRSAEGVTAGFSAQLDIDPATMMARPRRVYTTGVMGGDWSAGVYAWDGSGNILRRDADGVKAESEVYGYDLLSRLVSWTKGTVGETYGFDPFGNLTNYNGRSLASEASTNRLVHASYDGSGNLTSLMGFGFTWDGISQQLRISGQGLDRRFAYDAAGERLVERAGSEYTLTLRRWDHKVVRQVRASLAAGSWSWSWEKDWVWGQGSLLATIGAMEGMQQVVVDHQGSVGLLTNRCGQRLAELVTNPWGLDLFSSTQNGERHRVTGHLRDTNALDRAWDDFDYMHARYYFPYTARFLSVDPGRDYDLSRPQSFNLYTYVRNNAVNQADPTGAVAVAVVPLWAAAGAVATATVAWMQAPSITNPRFTNAEVLGKSLATFSRQLPTWRPGSPRDKAETNARERAKQSAKKQKSDSENSPKGPRWGTNPPPGAAGAHNPVGETPQGRMTPDERYFLPDRWAPPPLPVPVPNSFGGDEKREEANKKGATGHQVLFDVKALDKPLD